MKGPRRACRKSVRQRNYHLHHNNRTNNLTAAYSRNLCHITAGIDTGRTGTGSGWGRFATVPAAADAQGQGGTPGQGSASEGNAERGAALPYLCFTNEERQTSQCLARLTAIVGIELSRLEHKKTILDFCPPAIFPIVSPIRQMVCQIGVNNGKYGL